MNDTQRSRFGRAARGWVVALLLGGLAVGCKENSRPAPDLKAVEKEAERLKEQHKREMEGK